MSIHFKNLKKTVFEKFLTPMEPTIEKFKEVSEKD